MCGTRVPNQTPKSRAVKLYVHRLDPITIMYINIWCGMHALIRWTTSKSVNWTRNDHFKNVTTSISKIMIYTQSLVSCVRRHQECRSSWIWYIMFGISRHVYMFFVLTPDRSFRRHNKISATFIWWWAELHYRRFNLSISGTVCERVKLVPVCA